MANRDNDKGKLRKQLAQAKGELAEAQMLHGLAKNRREIVQIDGDVFSAYEEVTNMMLAAIVAHRKKIPDQILEQLRSLVDCTSDRLGDQARSVEQLRERWLEDLHTINPIIAPLLENDSPLKPTERTILQKKFNDFKLALEQKLEIRARGNLEHD